MGVLVLKFSTSEDRLWVLKNGPWQIGGNKPLILKEWTTGMAIDWTSFDSIPVWAKVIDIDPMLLSSNHMIEVIGNMIGKPISIHHITNVVDKISFARILVEITREEAKRTEIVLESYNGTIYKHKVEFEWLPWMCDSCNTFGHSTWFCMNKRFTSVSPSQGHGSLDLGSKVEPITLGMHKTWAQVVDRQSKRWMHATSHKEKGKENIAISVNPLKLRNGQGLSKWVEKKARPVEVEIGESSLVQEKNGKTEPSSHTSGLAFTTSSQPIAPTLKESQTKHDKGKLSIDERWITPTHFCRNATGSSKGDKARMKGFVEDVNPLKLAPDKFNDD